MDGVNVEIAGFLYESGDILSKKDMLEIGAGHYELMSDRGFDGGVEKLVRLKDLDAAQSELAVLNEHIELLTADLAWSENDSRDQSKELAALREELSEREADVMANAGRRVAAEQRNESLRGLLRSASTDYACCLESGYDRITQLGGGCDSVSKMLDDNPNYAKYIAALKPTESGASDKCASDGGICGLGGHCGECPHVESGASE